MHTPGPWEYRDVEGAGLQVCGPVSELHGVDLPRGMPEVVHFFTLAAPQNVLIGSERWVQFEPKGWHEMQEANARLIATAPDLLEALRETNRLLLAARTFQNDADVRADFKSHIDANRAAIAKAEGASLKTAEGQKS